jgi:hypothetical protein
LITNIYKVDAEKKERITAGSKGYHTLGHMFQKGTITKALKVHLALNLETQQMKWNNRKEVGTENI